jgi:hypothetical protein
MIKQLVTAMTLAFTPVAMATPTTVQAQRVTEEEAREVVLRSVEKGATKFCTQRQSGETFDTAAKQAGEQAVVSLANMSGVSEEQAYNFLMGTTGDKTVLAELLFLEISEKCPEELEE